MDNYLLKHFLIQNQKKDIYILYKIIGENIMKIQLKKLHRKFIKHKKYKKMNTLPCKNSYGRSLFNILYSDNNTYYVESVNISSNPDKLLYTKRRFI